MRPAPLVAFLAVIVLQRLGELVLSARNAQWMRARGGVERGREHFPWFVVLHTLYPIALAAEALARGGRPVAAWPLWLDLFVLAQALRLWAMRSLGAHWNVRVWVVPGTAPIRRGPYRWLRHPNYVAVIVELIAGPMLFGAWRTAIAFSVMNAVLLRARIRVEEAALAEVAQGADRRSSAG